MRRIQDGIPGALADEPDAVHRLRTSVRRLRNVLAAFRRYLNADATADLRSRLAEWGSVLGAARDLEVRAEQTSSAAREAGLDDDARAALVDPLLAAHARAHDDVVRWAGSDRDRDLLRLLVVWSQGPPLRGRASTSARKAARRVVRRQADRTLAVVHGLDDDEGAGPGSAGVEAAHELRKAARRLRHTCEAVTEPPVELLGGTTASLGSAGHRLQSLLGAHRDALLLAEHVRTEAKGSAAHDAVVRVGQARALAALAELPSALVRLQSRRDRLGG